MLASLHRSPRRRDRIVVSPTVPSGDVAQLPGWVTSSAVSDEVALMFSVSSSANRNECPEARKSYLMTP